MAREYHPEEIYPNSPLVEVVCEIRFPPSLLIDSQKHEFQLQIEGEYPRLKFVAGAQGRQNLASFRFENAEMTAGILLGLDKLARYDKAYSGHKNFIRQFFVAFDAFKKAFPIKTLTRVGWRYINIIPFLRGEEGLVPLEDFLNIKILYSDAPARHLGFDVTMESRLGPGSLTTKLATLRDQNTEREALLLDFDYALTENLRLSNLRPYIRDAHRETRRAFELMITDGYRAFLRAKK